MNLDIWTTIKSASNQLWTWLSNAISDNPLISLGILAVILVFWWARKPKFKNG